MRCQKVRKQLKPLGDNDDKHLNLEAYKGCFQIMVNDIFDGFPLKIHSEQSQRGERAYMSQLA